MKTIWKWELTQSWKWELSPQTVINMPKGAQVLCVKEQNNGIKLWALVDTMAENERRVFCVYGTGHAIKDEPGVYIGSVLLDSGSLVFHIFEDEKVSCKGV